MSVNGLYPSNLLCFTVECGSRNQFCFVTHHCSLLAPFGVDQPLGKNVKLLQRIKNFVGCLSCQVPNSPDVLFYKGLWPRVWPLRALWICSAQNSQVQSAQRGYQNREICFAWDAAKRRTPLNNSYFWVMQCCYVWNRGKLFWHPSKPLHTERNTSVQAAGMQ